LSLPDAVRLFLDRAREVQRGWHPESEEVEAVRQLCEQVDGLPLALELAAARTRTLDVLEVVQGLGSQPQLLSQPGAGLAPHHRSLEAALQWTYDLLSPSEQQELRALSVFDGGFDLAAAGTLLDRAAPGAVAELVRRSFLNVDRSTANWRYLMLTSVRGFAAARAAEDELSRWSRLHRRWMSALGAEAATELRGPAAAQWLTRLDRERSNIRAAARSAVIDGEAGVALALGADLAWYWYRRGLATEGILLLREALKAARPDQPERGRALLGLSLLQYLEGDAGTGLQSVHEALVLLRQRNDVAPLTTAESTAAWLSGVTGDLTGARLHAERARELAPTPALQAEAIMVLGQLARFDRDARQAEQLLTASVELAEAAGDRWVAASSGWVAAKLALADGRPQDALGHARAGRGTADPDGDIPGLLAVGLVTAAALARAGRPEDSRRLAAAVAAGGRRIGYDIGRMDPLDSPWLRRELPPALEAAPTEDVPLVLQDVLGLPDRAISTRALPLESRDP
jgi:hypothetical protein